MPDEFVLDCLEKLRPMLFNLANNYHLDSDDVLQDAAVIILETLPRLDLSRNVVSYLWSTITCRMIDRARKKKIETISLHTPLTKPGLTLEDTLPAASGEINHKWEDERTEIVHQSLRRLPLDEQLYLQRAYKLAAFSPCPKTPPRTRSQVVTGQSARRHLRADWQLIQTVYC